MKYYELTKEEEEILSAIENDKMITRPKSELKDSSQLLNPHSTKPKISISAYLCVTLRSLKSAQ